MWNFWIDTGGTFTDCLACSPDGQVTRVKVLSSSRIRALVAAAPSKRQLRLSLPQQTSDGFFEGYGFQLAAISGGGAKVVGWDAEKREATLDADLAGVEAGALCEFCSPEEPPILAARLVTGSRLGEALPPLEMRLATTRGTNALLERKGAKVAFLVTSGFGDLLRIGTQQRPDLFAIGIRKPEPLNEIVYEVTERLDAEGRVERELDEADLVRFAREALADGVEAFAVALLHSYLNPSHERRIKVLLSGLGARHVSTSSELSPYAKILPRAQTAVVDAYLAPIMDAYLDAVHQSMGNGRLRIMTSAGGLVSRDAYRAKDSLLSGPAGGVVGASKVGEQAGHREVIAFDMGGTSADVSRFAGQLDYRFEQRIGAAQVFAPTLRIETVAAGGGSLCWFDGMALRVGPESAGAQPGPACYGAGGPLTLTDVNLLLGRLDVASFGLPVFPDAARERLRALASAIAETRGEHPDEIELLKGFLDIANERMAETIRKVSVGEGFEASRHALVAFGGAGGLHACAIADILGMDTVLFPADAGLLSAFGLQAARVEQFAGRQVLQPLEDCLGQLDAWRLQLEAEARERLEADGVAAEEQESGPVRYELRFAGQESVLTLEDQPVDQLAGSFREAYEDQFGFAPSELTIELVALRLSRRSGATAREWENFEAKAAGRRRSGGKPLQRASLSAGDTVEGPAVVQDAYSTLYVDAGWSAVAGSRGTLKLRKVAQLDKATARSEVVELELFTNRYLSIVGEMGALLERAAFSTNVKDRKDFSCALLDPDGFLVANAPHIPVHLGALGVCLRSVLATLELEPGDVVVTNHPAFGGSHLPDVTLLAPVYEEGGDTLLGFVANRAHHAEIGGISPGSMPPDAQHLGEEGVVIPPMKLVAKGCVQWAPLEALLRESAYPSRSVAENVADLSAQLASIRRGAAALQDLARAEGAVRVVGYMRRLKARAAAALRQALQGRDLASTEAVERLDEGAQVSVRISSREDERWLIDFSGTAGVQASNYNATPAIVTSATIYALRLLAGTDVPLNEGFLDVVDLRIPVGMLNPSFHAAPERCPAVVAGNVELSQLIVSALLKALNLAAASQTTMNNFIFGNDRFGYYETIAGGEGASDEHQGASGVHTHMTNTAMTDPELMEMRYPVQVECFGLRRGSGGVGQWSGGDGIVKRVRFLDSVTLSLLTQRRQVPPFGLEGGGDGACGSQELLLPNGARVVLPGNGSVKVEPGSSVEIKTPGGGGWGAAK